MSKAKKERVEVPLNWHFPETIISRFATNMIVQVLKNEFKISFFEATPPLIFDSKQEPPSSVTAECVASIIVTADRLPEFIDALQRQLKLYEESKQ